MDPYARGIARGRPPCRKADVQARLVVVLDTRREARGLELIAPYTRAVKRYDVHEFILTDEAAGPGGTVRRVCGLGFAEVSRGGVLMVGDEVLGPGALRIGTVAGFDLSHDPNHLNVVIHVDRPLTGMELGLCPGDLLVFREPEPLPEGGRGAPGPGVDASSLPGR
ncbi:MAG: hypothetical protein K6T75_08835 [Acetobacteraceae bacterium]|nr:hypothetical protein [Acetobacteraceae bacterium]